MPRSNCPTSVQQHVDRAQSRHQSQSTLNNAGFAKNNYPLYTNSRTRWHSVSGHVPHIPHAGTHLPPELRGRATHVVDDTLHRSAGSLVQLRAVLNLRTCHVRQPRATIFLHDKQPRPAQPNPHDQRTRRAALSATNNQRGSQPAIVHISPRPRTFHARHAVRSCILSVWEFSASAAIACTGRIPATSCATNSNPHISPDAVHPACERTCSTATKRRSSLSKSSIPGPVAMKRRYAPCR